MHVEVSGTESGVPLVVFNGIPSRTDWAAPLVHRVQATHCVLVPHLPGYGRTPPLRPYSWSEVMDGLEQVLTPLIHAPAVLVGFSGGAWRALELATRGRIPVRGVFCVGGLAHATDAERASFRGFATALRGGFDATAIAAERFLARRRDSKAVEAAKDFVRATTAEVLADEMEALAAEPDLLPRLKALSCPIVLRTGTRDAACPPTKAEAIAAAAPHARVELIDGAGHALWLESPSDVLALPDFEPK